MLSISCARAVPMLLLITSSIHLAASSRGEASLIESDTVRGPEADVPKHCEEAVQHSHSASETIKALQACIEDLERHSSQSNAAHSKAKQTSQAYANDVNMLGSFVQSLKATLNKTYEKHKLQYTSLREDHQQVVSGLIQKLATLEALEGKERAHQHAGAGHFGFAWPQQSEAAEDAPDEEFAPPGGADLFCEVQEAGRGAAQGGSAQTASAPGPQTGAELAAAVCPERRGPAKE